MLLWHARNGQRQATGIRPQATAAVAQTAPFGLRLFGQRIEQVAQSGVSASRRIPLRLFFLGQGVTLMAVQSGKGNVPDDAGRRAKMISVRSNPMDHQPPAKDEERRTNFDKPADRPKNDFFCENEAVMYKKTSNISIFSCITKP
jgi:hypothetical protein